MTSDNLVFSALRTLACLSGFAGLAACAGDAEQPPSPRVVETIEAQFATISTSDRFPAVLRADDRGQLGFELAGLVQRINVDIGDRFRKGQLLATLEANQQQFGLQAISADLSQAQAAAREAELDFNRKAALEGTGAVSQSEIDNARRIRDEASARVTSIAARRGQAQDSLRDTRLYAPYAGVVTGRLAEPAEVVAPGEPILEASGLNAGLEAVITVPASQRRSFSIGQRLSFVPVDGDPLLAIVGKINAAAGANGLFEIILRVPGASAAGRAEGDRGEVQLQAEGERGISIPLSALRMRKDSGGSVLVVDPKSKLVSERTIAIAAVTDDGVIVSDGIRAGETVVAKGARLLRPGEAVRPTSQGPRQSNQ